LKALYGTKQAALLWHILIKQVLKDLGYMAEQADQCAFNYYDATGALVSKCVLHVDDLPMVAKYPSEFKRVADYLKHQAHLEINESES
ncbi:MAG: reverse transcriptase domain-containing protein, partial [bacterium]